MKKLKLKITGIMTVGLLAIAFFASTPQTIQAKEVGSTKDKACPDFYSDYCCEAGTGDCLETVEL